MAISIPRFESRPRGFDVNSRYPIFSGSPCRKTSVSGEKVGVIVGVSVGEGLGVMGAVFVLVGGRGVFVGALVSLGAGVFEGAGATVSTGGREPGVSSPAAWQLVRMNMPMTSRVATIPAGRLLPA